LSADFPGIAATAAVHAAAAAVLLLLLSLIGYAALPARLRPASARLALPLSLSAGTLLTGWLTFVSGSLLGTWSLLPVFALLVLFSLRSLRPWAADLGRVARLLAALVKASPFSALLLSVPVLLLAPALLLPLVDSDGLRYHVALPKLFLLTGQVFRYEWDVTGCFPQGAEMMYMLALRLSGGETAKFLHAGFFLSSLAVLALITHSGRASRSAALLAPFLFAVTPLAISPAPAAFTDHIALFHVGVATLLLVRRGPAAAIGIALGAAFATKVTIAPAAFGIAVAALFGRPRKERLRAAIAVALPVALAFLPFAIRSVLATGDPVYPVGHGLLGIPIPGVSDASLTFATNYHANTPGPLGFAWDLDWAPVEPDDVVGWHHLFGLFALGLVIRRRELRAVLAPVLPTVALALVYQPYSRYMMPLFFGLAFFEAWALVLAARRWAAPAALALAIPALIVSVPRSLFLGLSPLDYLRGRLSREAFMSQWIPALGAARLVNAQPPGGTVMGLDFPAPFYFDRPWIVEGILLEPPLKQWLKEDPREAALLERMQGLDVRYLVVTPGYGGGTPASLLPLAGSREQAKAVLALRARLRLVGTVEGVDVYEVPAP
jgi:hypothetical protein